MPVGAVVPGIVIELTVNEMVEGGLYSLAKGSLILTICPDIVQVAVPCTFCKLVRVHVAAGNVILLGKVILKFPATGTL